MTGTTQETIDRKLNPADDDNDITEIEGDPGVGAMLADPEDHVAKPLNMAKPESSAASPDPSPPDAHGDWAPNRAWRGRQKT